MGQSPSATVAGAIMASMASGGCSDGGSSTGNDPLHTTPVERQNVAAERFGRHRLLRPTGSDDAGDDTTDSGSNSDRQRRRRERHVKSPRRATAAASSPQCGCGAKRNVRRHQPDHRRRLVFDRGNEDARTRVRHHGRLHSGPHVPVRRVSSLLRDPKRGVQHGRNRHLRSGHRRTRKRGDSELSSCAPFPAIPFNPSALCGAGNTCDWFPQTYAPAEVTDCNFAGDNVSQQSCDKATSIASRATRARSSACVRSGAEWAPRYTADCPTKYTCKDAFTPMGETAPFIRGITEGLSEQ